MTSRLWKRRVYSAMMLSDVTTCRDSFRLARGVIKVGRRPHGGVSIEACPRSPITATRHASPLDWHRLSHDHKPHLPLRYKKTSSRRPRHQTEIVNGAHPGAGARTYSLYPRHVRASILPQKETKYSYNAFQARDRRDKSECDSAVYSSLHGIQSFHYGLFRFLIPKMPKIPKFLSGNLDRRWSVQLFLPGPWQFLLGPCPRGPHPGDGAGSRMTQIWQFLVNLSRHATHCMTSLFLRPYGDGRAPHIANSMCELIGGSRRINPPCYSC